MLEKHKPDIFCFATQPSARLALFEMAVEGGVKAIAMEKPVSLSVREAKKMSALIEQSGVQTVVSQQIKYRRPWQQARKWVEQGEIGALHTMNASSTGWHMQHAPHLVEYMSFFNGHVPYQWVFGSFTGTDKLSDDHPSPSYSFGHLAFQNDVRCTLSLGCYSPPQPESPDFWRNTGIVLCGEKGILRVTFGGYWSAVRSSRKGMQTGNEKYDDIIDRRDLKLYIEDLALWLDDPARGHICDGRIALRNVEAVLGLLISGIEGRKVDLPLPEGSIEPIPYLKNKAGLI
jgi:predicted dehydrogenase